MQNGICILCLCLIVSCANGPRVPSQESVITDSAAEDALISVTQPDTIAYFEGTGVEPFWGLKIAQTRVTLTSLIEGFERVVVPGTELTQTMDGDGRKYRIHTDTIELDIEIAKEDCVNSMSGDSFPYRVQVHIRHAVDTSPTALSGCGKFIPDYRLHDIWTLERLNGKSLENNDFAQQRPYIEINASQQSFIGYGGCNNIGGKLFVEQQTLRVSDVVTTLKACDAANKEMEFLTALKSSTLFELRNNRLILSNSDDETLVFRHTD